jgi:hypothetical protein
MVGGVATAGGGDRGRERSLIAAPDSWQPRPYCPCQSLLIASLIFYARDSDLILVAFSGYFERFGR